MSRTSRVLLFSKDFVMSFAPSEPIPFAGRDKQAKRFMYSFKFHLMESSFRDVFVSIMRAISVTPSPILFASKVNQ